MIDLKAVIFDLDGTLIDSMGIWVKVDVKYLSRRNIPVTPDLFKDVPAGNSFHELAHYVKDKFDLPDTIEEICHEWTEMVRDHYENDIKLKVGVLELITYLKEHEIEMAIGTSNSELLTESVLRSNKIRDFFRYVISGDQDLRGKPFPDIFLKAAAALKIKPENCLVLEDTLAGAKAAVAAGMKVICVQDEDSKKEWQEIEKIAIFSAKEIIDIGNFIKIIMRCGK